MASEVGVAVVSGVTDRVAERGYQYANGGGGGALGCTSPWDRRSFTAA